MPTTSVLCTARVTLLVDAIRKNLADHPKIAGIEHDVSSGEVVFTLCGGRRYTLSDAKFLSIYELPS